MTTNASETAANEVPTKTAASPRDRTSLLQTLSHVLILGAGLIYLLGFFVVSLFDASLGITDYSLLRPRVVAVGILFCFLAAVPVVLTFRTFSMFGLQRELATGIAATPENMGFLIADVVLNLPFPCAGFVWALAFLFQRFPEWRAIGFAIFLLQTTIVIATGIMARKWFNARPKTFVLVSFLNAVVFFLSIYRYADRTFFWFVVWLTSVSVFTFSAYSKTRTQNDLRKTEWERWVLIALPIIFLTYANRLYPKMRREFGGGAPVPVILHLNKKLAPFDLDIVPVSLVDETEQGYYVLREPDKAAFISRGLVEEVEFLPSAQDKSSPKAP
jgi:hypothetical protein